MPVPGNVPAIVPAAGASGGTAETPAAEPPREAAAARLGPPRTPSYLTGDPSGWRFQMRLPAWLQGLWSYASSASILKKSLGPGPRREAERTARMLAALCADILARHRAALERQKMDQVLDMTAEQHALAEQVVDACQTAIGLALADPARSIGLARTLETARSTLLSVQAEVARGDAGLPAIRNNAEAITRDTLASVLALASNPLTSAEVLRAVAGIAPSAGDVPMPTAAAPSGYSAGSAREELLNGTAPRMPLFSAVSAAYIAMRKAADGPDHKDIKYLELRRQTFLDVVGDRPVTEYFPSDLQDYVSAMQFWPANATKRAELAGKSTREILEENKDLKLKPLARKTMKEGYVANLRTMMRFGMQDHRYRDPFEGVKLKYPAILAPSKVREGIDIKVLDDVFAHARQTGELLKLLLPLLAVLTSRRLALLIYLTGSDLREKYGVQIAQSDGIVEVNGAFRRVPIKTDDSMTFFVLHDFLQEIGFVDWAKRQQGWVFAAAHEHPDPAKYVSQMMNRMLRRCGAAGANTEVFHCLRGDGITQIRDTDVRDRGVRLQAGHELSDVHDGYGLKALSAKECRELATRPLPEGIDWSVFRGLDFDALAATRPTRGRRPNKA